MDQLLRTKLFIPRLPTQTVPRPHLTAQLDAGLQGKLVLVAAPAGFGKTTLVAEWVSRAGGLRLAWLSLDAGDNELQRFLTYLIAALRTVDPALGSSAILSADDISPPSAEMMMASLVNELASSTAEGEPMVLVLDDYHLIEDRAIHEALAFLLTHGPPDMHIVLTTRVDPPLPLARLRARRQMIEIREAALRFSPGEVGSFFNETMHLDLEPQDIAVLEAKTEGWIASLQLAALAMQSPTLPSAERHAFVQSFAGSDRYVADYLVGEVLDHQPPEIESFLLQTAILDRLCAPLCDHVRGHAHTGRSSQAILEELERANLFVQPQDNQRRWYCYHQLFADLLRHRLSERHPEQVTQLHSRASEWFERNDSHEEAIEHALAAADYDRAARLIEPVAHPLFSRGKMMTLHRWLSALPAELIRSRPQLYLIEGWLLYRLGRFGALETFLHGSPAMETPDLPATYQGELLILRAHNAYLRGHFDDCAQLVDQALTLIPPDESLLQMPLLSLQGWCFDACNEIEAAIAAFAEAAKLGRAADSLTGTVASQAKLVHLHARLGESDRAEALNEELQAYLARHGGVGLPLAGPASIGMGIIDLRQGDLSGGEERLRAGIALCRQWGGLRMEVINGYIALIQGLQEQGRRRQAEAVLAEAEHFAQEQETPAWMVERMRRIVSQASESPMSGVSSGQFQEPLTQRELDVLRLMAENLSAPQIADRLIVGVSTVRTHIKRLYAKLDAHNRSEALERARDRGLI